MSTLHQRKANTRTVFLSFFLILWLSGLIVRLIQLQVFEHARLKADVIEQNQNKEPIKPKRGTIYDCRGNILARSLPVQSVFYSPFKSEPYDLQLKKMNKLKEVLDLSDYELRKIKIKIKKNHPFIWIKRKISPEKEKKVEELTLNGIHFLEENKRFYPHGKFAAHLLGRVDIDDNGASGIEYRYNSELGGVKGEYLILKDAKKREYRFEILKAPKAGKDLFLTIDETIQYCAEKELEKAVRKSRAEWGTAILAQPFTGEILAMANYPTYNLNNLPSIPTVVDRNQAIHHNFEPGSTFKVVTACAALEEGIVNLDDIFDCSKGSISVAGKTVRDHHRFGILSFPEVIIHSSNVGTIQISRGLDRDIFYRTIRDFGFGQQTGIDLPAEEKGIFRTLDNWSRISPDSLSIGYEISVTALQMLQTINVVANKGVLVPPKIVKKVLGSSDEPIEKPSQSRRIISDQTASTLASILQGVVERGTGIEAQIKGYRVAGKTGTARKFDKLTGTYSFTSHTASFVGFVPADKPAISMIVVIDEPKGPYFGGEVAAPVFSKIASQVLRYLCVPPQDGSLKTIIVDNRWRQIER